MTQKKKNPGKVQRDRLKRRKLREEAAKSEQPAHATTFRDTGTYQRPGKMADEFYASGKILKRVHTDQKGRQLTVLMGDEKTMEAIEKVQDSSDTTEGVQDAGSKDHRQAEKGGKKSREKELDEMISMINI